MPIDLRSDTVTQPTEAMREAMASAVVGDDVYGEDPTINRLEALAAEAVGKEAALFVPSGTMGNLVAVKAHTEPGNEAIVERTSHILLFEMGGMAWLSGVMPRVLDGRDGALDPEEVASNLHMDVPHYIARTGVVCLENTHNYAGGAVYPIGSLAATCAAARALGVPVHLDGARLFNASVASGMPAREICRHVDSVMFAFSNGLSAPVGAAVAGSRAFIERARRVRRAAGGGMRQAGILAAAAIVALETMVDRLSEDHARARELATGLAALPGVILDPSSVQTNIVMFRHVSGARACQAWVDLAREATVLCSQLSPDSVRLVTHRHIGAREVQQALDVFGRLAPRAASV
jgi:threonine aldolase